MEKGAIGLEGGGMFFIKKGLPPAFSYGFRLGVRLMIEVGMPLIKEIT